MDEASKFYNNGEVAAITPALLQGIFDTLPAGIEMLKPIRDKNNKIVDFEYIIENDIIKNRPGYNGRVGKKFLTENGGDGELVEKIATLVESGMPPQGISYRELKDSAEWFDIKYIKYGDGIIVFRENITRKKLAEQGIREDVHFIDQIVETSPDIIYIMDLNTLQIIYTNRQIAAALGYSKQQIDQMKNPLIDIMYEEDLPSFIEHLKKIKTSGSDNKVMEIEYRLKDGNGDIRWFCDRNTVFKRNSRNVPVEKLGFSQDITARKEQEEQLRTDIELLTQVEEIADLGTWEYDIETDQFKWSDGMYRLFNLSRSELLSPEIYFQYTSEEEKEVVTRIVDNIMQKYNAFDETITLLPSGKEKKILRIRAVPVKDKKMNLLKMIGVDLDITQHVKATDEINELNKTLTIKNRDLQALNTELKTFNTVTASDFKDTLQLLYTNLEYIARNETRHLGDSAKANLRRAQSAIQKMKLLTDDINTYLQLYELGINLTRIDPNPILEHIIMGIQEQIKESNASIEAGWMPTLLADPYLFSRLLIQLIDNSFKFRKLIQPPVIKIKYSQADEMNSVPMALKNTPYAIISVSDNGIGFDDTESERIFELFYRIPSKIKYKGSGIGLAICKKIMAMHHGFITAEGTPAGGTTFNCYFPMR